MKATYLAWHGTNQQFTRFGASHRGLNTSNSASRKAFFFAARPDTSWAYAEYAARNLVPQQRQHDRFVAGLIRRAEMAMRHGHHDLYEKLINEAETAEGRVLQAEPAGARLLLCQIDNVDLMEVNGRDRAVTTDLAAVIDEAGRQGFDGLLIRDIHDIPAGACDPDDHFAIFHSAKIKIERSFELLADAMASRPRNGAFPHPADRQALLVSEPV